MERKQEYIDVRGDGRIVLYKRDGLKRPKWQARISVPNSTGYKIISTKTDDLVQAQVLATNLYEELYFKIKAGGSLRSKTFKQVFDEWEQSSARNRRTQNGGSWRRTVQTLQIYSVEYFRDKEIAEIKSKDFANYWDWRRSNYVRKPPVEATLRRECASFSPLFKFALQKGYITEIPDFSRPKSALRRRSTFTSSEWKSFYQAARVWVAEGQKMAVGRHRFVAQQYFLILANTGMRVGELRNLRWSDLKMVSVDDQKQLKGWVSGKTGAREVAFQPGSERYVKRLYDMRLEELGEHPDRDGLVICHPDGSPIASLKKSFKSLMEFAGLPLVRNEMTRTIYSLRHFYATQRLEHETSPFLLAKQMGTSVEMLEKFYGQTSVNAETMKNISKGNQQSSTSGLGSNSEYPFM